MKWDAIAVPIRAPVQHRKLGGSRANRNFLRFKRFYDDEEKHDKHKSTNRRNNRFEEKANDY